MRKEYFSFDILIKINVVIIHINIETLFVVIAEPPKVENNKIIQINVKNTFSFLNELEILKVLRNIIAKIRRYKNNPEKPDIIKISKNPISVVVTEPYPIPMNGDF